MDRIERIKKFLEQGLTAQQISNRLGDISRQRVYQLMTQHNLETPERRKKGYWKTQDEKTKWIQRTLNGKASREEREVLLDVLKQNLPTHCPILGIELVYGNVGIRADNSASIDRFNSDEPYTPENVNIISWRANRIKNNGTLEEHEKIVEWMKKNN